MNADPDDDEERILEVADPRIPLPIREHGARFRNPARYAVDVGNGKWLLLADDGEVLDVAWMR